jgi:hypothetical protein
VAGPAIGKTTLRPGFASSANSLALEPVTFRFFAFSAHLARCFSVFQPPNKTVILSVRGPKTGATRISRYEALFGSPTPPNSTGNSGEAHNCFSQVPEQIRGKPGALYGVVVLLLRLPGAS